METREHRSDAGDQTAIPSPSGAAGSSHPAYARIVVPLDGSELAEHVLPYVTALAATFGSQLILLQATTPPERLMATATPGMLPTAGPLLDSTPILEQV